MQGNYVRRLLIKNVEMIPVRGIKTGQMYYKLLALLRHISSVVFILGNCQYSYFEGD